MWGRMLTQLPVVNNKFVKPLYLDIKTLHALAVAQPAYVMCLLYLLLLALLSKVDRFSIFSSLVSYVFFIAFSVTWICLFLYSFVVFLNLLFPLKKKLQEGRSFALLTIVFPLVIPGRCLAQWIFVEQVNEWVLLLFPVSIKWRHTQTFLLLEFYPYHFK